MDIQRSNNSKSKYSWLGKTMTYEKPEETFFKDCICNRKRGLINCNNCQKSFMGRIGARCPVHPEIAYLMDARNCAFCGASSQNLQMAQI